MRIGGSCQQLYGMNDRHVQTALAAPPGDLQEAAWVGRRDHPRPGLGDPRELLVQEIARNARFEKVVDAGAAATELAVAELDQAKAGDPAEQLPGLEPQPLTVHEVTGIVVCHREIERAERKIGAGQNLRDVAYARGEGRQLRDPVAVFL